MMKVFIVDIDGYARDPEAFIVVAKDEEAARESVKNQLKEYLSITNIEEIDISKEDIIRTFNSCC